MQHQSQSQSRPPAQQADPRNSIDLFGDEVNKADMQRLVVASAPIYTPEQMQAICDEIIREASDPSKNVKVGLVWRQIQTASRAMPAPFEFSRGDAVIDEDNQLAIRYWFGKGNSPAVAGKTFKLPYQEPNTIEYSFIGFVVDRMMKESVAPPRNNVAVRPRTLVRQAPMERREEASDEDGEDGNRPAKMEPLYQGVYEIQCHDTNSIVQVLAELVGTGTNPAIAVRDVMDQISQQSNRSSLRFQNAAVDASQQTLKNAMLAVISDGFRSAQCVVTLESAVTTYRVAIASAVNGSKRTDQAIRNYSVNIPKNDILGRALGSLTRGRGRGRGGGRGRSNTVYCNHCKKYGHTVENCWQKQGQGNASRGEAGKATRQ